MIIVTMIFIVKGWFCRYLVVIKDQWAFSQIWETITTNQPFPEGLYTSIAFINFGPQKMGLDNTNNVRDTFCWL